MEKSESTTNLMELDLPHESSGRDLMVAIKPSIHRVALLLLFGLMVSLAVLLVVVTGVCIAQAHLRAQSQARETKQRVQISAMNRSISNRDSLISELKSQLEEFNNTIQDLSRNSLNRLNLSIPTDTVNMSPSRKTITTPTSPIRSCSALPSNSASGYYWVISYNGSAIRVYCDMDRTCGSITGGWTRVASLDMTLTSSRCPVGLCVSPIPVRTCRICSSYKELSYNEIYRVSISYSKVCGRIIAYQIGSPDAYHSRYSNGLDGIILTYGYPDINIWAFIAVLSEHFRPEFQCPCMNPNDTSIPAAPAYIGEHYFCDTAPQKAQIRKPVFYVDDPLWDGAGCEGTNTCCTFNNPPWFYRELPGTTTEDIKLKVKLDEPKSNEDIAIEKIDLYVQ